jgi:hypothetical protein
MESEAVGAMNNRKPATKKASLDYIDDWKEWQDNQFNPGHFTGGKQIPVLKNPGKPLIVGLGLLFMGLVSLVGFITNMAGFDPQTDSIWLLLLSNLTILAFAVVFLLAGCRMIRRGRKR